MSVNHEAEGSERVDRVELIDETGRVYVRGSIYGSPVTVELSYQDEGRTLKIFVQPRADLPGGNPTGDQ